MFGVNKINVGVMKHKEIEKNLIFFLEESLPDQEMKTVQLHLDSCDNCRLLSDELRADMDILASTAVKEINPYFYTRLKVEMEKPLEASRFRYRNLLQPALFSLLLLISIGVGVKMGGTMVNSDQVEKKNVSVFFELDEMNNEPIEQFLLTIE